MMVKELTTKKKLFYQMVKIIPQGRNVLMDAQKGTKVLTHEQQLFEMMQGNNEC
jgi:hypothetical protein